MTAFSNYLENKILDHTLRGAGGAYTAPTTVYVALFTAAPTDANSGTEVSAGNYARQSITFGSAASSGAISNTLAVTFPTATVSYGTVTHIGLYDALTTGNLMYHGAVTVSKTITVGDTFSIAVGNLTITLD
jgi:hypothetical protein